jgi:hypothetical protein
MTQAANEPEFALLTARILQLEKEKEWRNEEWIRMRKKAKMLNFAFLTMGIVGLMFNAFVEADKYVILFSFIFALSSVPISLLIQAPIGARSIGWSWW